MTTTVSTERVPILVWGEMPDEAAMDQARNLANLPFAFRHVALMPDAHVGFGMPIGGVLAALGQVVPHAVGLDIGCGVRGWRTNVPAGRMAPVLDTVLSEIKAAVPLGFDWHKVSQARRTSLFDQVPDSPALRAQLTKAELQVGSLGGGNHFMELQTDPEGIVWAMVHSGSRNVGLKVAEHYDAVARADNRRRASEVPDAWGLAHLAVDGDEGAEYLEAMGWCLRFAYESRRLMAVSMQQAISRQFPDIEPDDATDVHHNYASVEEHFGTTVVIHRKGAVRARGTVLVPGSMGTSSYIGRGLANADSFESCSHGAGRAMGRTTAKRAFPRQEVMAGLRQRGVHLLTASPGDIAEEAPQAYKDIEDVMRYQADLVEPVIRLVPIGVVKG